MSETARLDEELAKLLGALESEIASIQLKPPEIQTVSDAQEEVDAAGAQNAEGECAQGTGIPPDRGDGPSPRSGGHHVLPKPLVHLLLPKQCSQWSSLLLPRLTSFLLLGSRLLDTASMPDTKKGLSENQSGCIKLESPRSRTEASVAHVQSVFGAPPEPAGSTADGNWSEDSVAAIELEVTRQELAQSQSKCAELSEQLEAARNQVRLSEFRTRGLEARVQRLTMQLHRAQEARRQADADYQVADRQRNRLEVQVSGASAHIAGLRSLLEQREHDLTQQRSLIKVQRRTLMSREDRIKVMEQSMKNMREHMRAQQDSIEVFQAEELHTSCESLAQASLGPSIERVEESLDRLAQAQRNLLGVRTTLLPTTGTFPAVIESAAKLPYFEVSPRLQ